MHKTLQSTWPRILLYFFPLFEWLAHVSSYEKVTKRVGSHCSLTIGTCASTLFTKSFSAYTLTTRSANRIEKEKIKVLRSFQAKYLVEDVSIYQGDLALNLLVHRDHPLSSSQNISSHMSLPWPIKEGFMDYVKGGPRKAFLCCWIEVWY